VRSSWLMFAGTTLLYLEMSESFGLAFSSRLARRQLTSRFFTSMLAFCSSSCLPSLQLEGLLLSAECCA